LCCSDLFIHSLREHPVGSGINAGVVENIAYEHIVAVAIMATRVSALTVGAGAEAAVRKFIDETFPGRRAIVGIDTSPFDATGRSVGEELSAAHGAHVTYGAVVLAGTGVLGGAGGEPLAVRLLKTAELVGRAVSQHLAFLDTGVLKTGPFPDAVSARLAVVFFLHVEIA
jgi:hypothetical protein